MATYLLTRAGETEPIEIEADGYQFFGSAIAFYDRPDPPTMFYSPHFLVAYNDWVEFRPAPPEQIEP